MIRVVKISDIPQLLRIYSYYVLHTAITFEYEVPTETEFEKRIQTILSRYPYIVYEENNQILGYAYASSFKGRKAYDWSVETTIYVDVNCKHKGIGKQLYTALEFYLKKQNILNVNACISYIEQGDKYLDLNSVHFHEHMGYSMVGQFHQCGYKFNRWYSMVWMEKFLGSHKVPMEEVLPFLEVFEK
ncbi:MAG: GNAT family N-acetyltransferase [Floccifex sp.]